MKKKNFKTIISIAILTLLISGLILSNLEKKTLAGKKEPISKIQTETKPKKQLTAGEIQLNEYLNNNKPTMIFFSSEYCRDCHHVKPIIKALEEEHKEKIDFLTIDVRAKSSIAQAAKSKYKVLGVPLVVFIKKDGTKQKSIAGFYPEDNYKTQAKLLLKE